MSTRDWDTVQKSDDDSETIEVASQHKKIASTNIGHQLLAKMGWKDGTGLGTSQQGITEPISVVELVSKTGLGKQTEAFEKAELATRRKTLESITHETESETAARIESAARIQADRERLAEYRTATSFLCELCNKSYTRIGEYEGHLDSYDHAHRKRKRDLKEMTMEGGTEAQKEEREKKRQAGEMKEMELRAQRLAAAEKAIQKPLPSAPLPTKRAAISFGLKKKT